MMTEYNFKPRKYYMAQVILWGFVAVAAVVGAGLLAGHFENGGYDIVLVFAVLGAIFVFGSIIATRYGELHMLCTEYQAFQEDLYYIEHMLNSQDAIVRQTEVLLNRFEAWENRNHERLKNL